jgi:uncharacterized membrane protein
MGDRITKSIRVNAPLNQVYQAWSRFENFPLFMENIKTVWMIGPRTSIWEAVGPMGSLVQVETTKEGETNRCEKL